MAKKKRHRMILFLSITALVLYVWWSTTAIQVTRLTIHDAEIPTEFDGFTIAQVSDLHNAEFGPDNRTLLEKLTQARPDIIVLTGDMIDSRRTNVDVSAQFVRQCISLAPTYYITGNHESRIPEAFHSFRTVLEGSGVTILDDATVSLTRGNTAISLAGLNDPAFGSFEQALGSLPRQKDRYTILLSHRPERIDQYARYGADLVFTGHAHGGQISLPLLGPIIAPNQGLFPQYTSGIYVRGGTQMVVSRGLGTSVFPIRFNARPELVIARLSPGNNH